MPIWGNPAGQTVPVNHRAGGGPESGPPGRPAETPFPTASAGHAVPLIRRDRTCRHRRRRRDGTNGRATVERSPPPPLGPVVAIRHHRAVVPTRHAVPPPRRHRGAPLKGTRWVRRRRRSRFDGAPQPSGCQCPISTTPEHSALSRNNPRQQVMLSTEKVRGRLTPWASSGVVRQVGERCRGWRRHDRRCADSCPALSRSHRASCPAGRGGLHGVPARQ